MKINDLVFPILVIDTEDTDFFPIRRINQITTSTIRLFKSKKLIGSEVVDDHNRLFKVTNLQKVGNRPIRGLIELFDRTIEIDIELEELVSEYPLAKLKDRLLKLISRDMDAGTDLWSHFYDKAFFKNELEKTMSLREIIDLILEEK